MKRFMREKQAAQRQRQGQPAVRQQTGAFGKENVNHTHAEPPETVYCIRMRAMSAVGINTWKSVTTPQSGRKR